MELIGAAAFSSAIEDMIDYHTPETDGYLVGNSVEYTAHQEFGTVHQDGTPHFRPGMDATRAQLAQIAARASGIDEFMKLAALQWEAEAKSRAPVGETGNLRAGWETQPL